jgi:uncharacterized protein involved in outer membrane biogenesis
MTRYIVAAALLLATLLGVSLWARSMLSGERVRQAVERQLSASIGQPVAVTRVSVGIWPRATMRLEGVRIGEPARITMERLDLATGLRALLSRRIEHATATLVDARVELPLPSFAFEQGSNAAAGSDGPAVTIGSIDAIALRGLTVVSAGREWHGDLDLAPHDGGLELRHAALTTQGTDISVSGDFTTLAGPTGSLKVVAGNVDMIGVMALVSDVVQGVTLRSTPAGTAPAPASPMHLTVTIEAAHAAFGTLMLDTVRGRAVVTPGDVTFDPMRFGLFGGRYDGAVGLTLGAAPAFHLRASIADVDLGALTRFAGAADAITGRLAATMDVTGRGTTAADVIASVAGQARIDATNGTVRNLGLLRTVVVATSMRQDARTNLGTANAQEPYSTLGATFRLSGGSAATDDLRFESPDLTLTAHGTLRLDGRDVDLGGDAQLSDALSKQAGRDLVRYTQENGRVTVPVTVTGRAGDLHVGVDLADAATRAIKNRLRESAIDAIRRGLDQLRSN